LGWCSRLDLLQRLTAPSELFLNGFDCYGPDEGTRILIPSQQEVVDGRLQVGNAAEDNATDSFVIEVAEPTSNKIQPT
jgi:hypothetical protein